jgi:hypothetical protein
MQHTNTHTTSHEYHYRRVQETTAAVGSSSAAGGSSAKEEEKEKKSSLRQPKAPLVSSNKVQRVVQVPALTPMSMCMSQYAATHTNTHCIPDEYHCPCPALLGICLGCPLCRILYPCHMRMVSMCDDTWSDDVWCDAMCDDATLGAHASIKLYEQYTCWYAWRWTEWLHAHEPAMGACACACACAPNVHVHVHVHVPCAMCHVPWTMDHVRWTTCTCM